MIEHYQIHLLPRRRGVYLITTEVVGQIGSLPPTGLFHLFIRHTSAGLTINENADPDVRMDFERFMNHIVPERMPFVVHDMEGDDDMPAHVKSSLVGSSISVPIIDGRLALGTWQGIYLCEFRDATHQRELIATIYS
ncbi:MAG: secondary thiamine-phosphate synthase enzyme YjbQ [Bacteroidota bacterium]